MITVENARDRFLLRLGRSADSLVSLPVSTAFEEMLAFFALEPFLGASDDGDMMLYQWGTNDWHDGDGAHLSVNLTRQMIAEQGEDEDIHQLSLTYRYRTVPTIALESGNRWCKDRDEIARFSEFVVGSSAFVAVKDLRPFRALLSYGSV